MFDAKKILKKKLIRPICILLGSFTIVFLLLMTLVIPLLDRETIEEDIAQLKESKLSILGGTPSYTVVTGTNIYLAQSHQMARTSNGTLWIGYREDDDIHIAWSENSGETWSTQMIYGADRSWGGNIAVDSNDVVHMTYYGETTEDANNFRIQYTNSTDWGELVTLRYIDGNDYYFSDIAIDSNDDIHIVYEQDDGNSAESECWYIRSLDNGGSWETSVQLTDQNDGTKDLWRPSIWINSTDGIHVLTIWDTYSTFHYVFHMWSDDYGATWNDGFAEDTDPIYTPLNDAGNTIGGVVTDDDTFHAVSFGGLTDDAYYVYNTSDGSSWSSKETISASTDYTRISCTDEDDMYMMISDSDDKIYISNRWSGQSSWSSPSELIGATVDQANLLSVQHPTIGGVKTNRPATGYAMCYVGNTRANITYYPSANLTWETADTDEWQSIQTWNTTLKNDTFNWQSRQTWNTTLINNTFSWITRQLWNTSLVNLTFFWNTRNTWNTTLKNDTFSWQSRQVYNTTLVNNTFNWNSRQVWNTSLVNETPWNSRQVWNTTLVNLSWIWQSRNIWNTTLVNNTFNWNSRQLWNTTLVNNTFNWQSRQTWNTTLTNDTFNWYSRQIWNTTLSNSSFDNITISGRVLYNNTFTPVENLTVTINDINADIYGTTFLLTNVTPGQITIFANDTLDTNNVTYSFTSTHNLHSIRLLLNHTEGTAPTVTVTAGNFNIDWGQDTTLNLTKTPIVIFGIAEVKINGTIVRDGSIDSDIPRFSKYNNGGHQTIIAGTCKYDGYYTDGETVIIKTHYEPVSDAYIYVNWSFTPFNRTAEGDTYQGIGYKFDVSSATNLTMITFNCSWELTGDIANNDLYCRRANTFWNHSFTTAESYSSDLNTVFGKSEPPIYLYNSTDALISYPYPPDSIENEIHKWTDGTQLCFTDEHIIGNLTDFNTSYRIILHSDVSGIDNYTYIYDEINTAYKDFYGITESDFIPAVYIRQELDNGTGTPLNYITVANDNISELENMSFKRMFILSTWLSNGRIGSPYNINRLAIHELEFHADDINDLNYFIDKTDEHDINLTIWVADLFSQNSSLMENNTDWRQQNIDGTFTIDGQDDCWMFSTRSPFLNYTLAKLQNVTNNFNIEGLWWNGFSTSYRVIDYTERASIKSHVDQLAQVISATQQMGFEPHGEALSPFISTSCNSNVVTPPNAPNGTFDLDYAFGGREYLLYKTTLGLKDTGGDYNYNPIRFDYYKYIANKAMPSVHFYLLNDTEKNFINQSNQDYNAVYQYMDKREVIVDDSYYNGTLWHDTETDNQTLFACNNFQYTVTGNINNVLNVTTGESVTLSGGSFNAVKYNTYRMNKTALRNWQYRSTWNTTLINNTFNWNSRNTWNTTLVNNTFNWNSRQVWNTSLVNETPWNSRQIWNTTLSNSSDDVDWYVSNNGADSNDGLTISTPWENISKVTTELDGGLISEGDNIWFERDDTFDDDQLRIRTGGTYANPMTIGAYGTGSKPKFSYSGSTASAIKINWQVDNVTVQDINITGNDGDSAFLFDTNSDCSDMNFYRLEFYDNEGNSLYIRNTNDTLIENWHSEPNDATGHGLGIGVGCFDFIIRNSTFQDCLDGVHIHFTGTEASEVIGNIWIDNVTVYNTTEEGFDISGGDGCENILITNSSAGHSIGESPIAVGHATDNVTIDNCTFYDCVSGNIMTFTGSDITNQASNNTIIRNSIFYEWDSNGITKTSVGNEWAENITIYNCDIITDGVSDHIQTSTTYIDNVTLKNNIFYSIAQSSPGNFFMYQNEYLNDSTTESINNMWWRGDGGSGDDTWWYIYNAPYDFTEWNAFTNVDGDLRDDPELDYSDWTLNSTSPCIDAGEWLTQCNGGGTGQVITVDDANYFFPGIFSLSVSGDNIFVGDDLDLVITNINYDTEQITVNRSITWSNNDWVSLSNYQGNKVDIGAKESSYSVRNWQSISTWNTTLVNNTFNWNNRQVWNTTLVNLSWIWQSRNIWNTTLVNNTFIWNSRQVWNTTLINTTAVWQSRQTWNTTLVNNTISWISRQIWNTSLVNLSWIWQSRQTWNTTLVNNTFIWNSRQVWNTTLVNLTREWTSRSTWNTTLVNETPWNSRQIWNTTLYNSTQTYITVSNIYPADESINIPLQPTMYLTINHSEGAQMNASFYYGTQGNEIHLLGTSNNFYNSTQSQINWNASERFTSYYWRVMVNAGDSYENFTLSFRTEGYGGGGIITSPYAAIAFGAVALIIALLIFIFLRRRRNS